MRLVDYLSLVRHRLPLVAAVMGIVALIALGMSLTTDPMYRANVRLRALPPAPTSFGSGVDAILQDSSVMFTDMGTEAELVRSVRVGATVAEELDLAASPHDLIDQITVHGVPNTRILDITVHTVDPVLAVEMANAFAGAYLEVRRTEAEEALDRADERLRARLIGVQERLDTANGQLQAAPPESVAYADAGAQRDLALADLAVIRDQLRSLAERSALEGGFGEVIVPAQSPDLVRSTSPMRALVFGVLLGAPLAFAVVLLLDSLSEAVRTIGEAENATDAPVIGLIPTDDRLVDRVYRSSARDSDREGPRKARRPRRRSKNNALADAPIVATDPFCGLSEAYRTTSVNLASTAAEHGVRTVLVTSALAGEGKTTTTTNLVTAYAERGHEALVVDADLRRPAVHEVFDVDPGPGVADLLTNTRTTARRVMKNVRPHLRLVTGGEPVERPDQLLNEHSISVLFDKLTVGKTPRRKGSRNGSNEKGECSDSLIMLDSAPVLQAAETLALAEQVDAVVLVVRAGVTRRQAASRAAQQIRRAGGHLIGVLLVGVRETVPLGLDGYDSGSGRRLSVVESADNGHVAVS